MKVKKGTSKVSMQEGKIRAKSLVGWDRKKRINENKQKDGSVVVVVVLGVLVVRGAG
jgi:hypothetical protein